MNNTIAVLVPIDTAGIAEISISPRVNDLKDKVIGFLWNSKPNGDILLHRIEELLSQRFHLAGTRWLQKSSATFGADTTITGELAGAADLVINAIGD